MVETETAEPHLAQQCVKPWHDFSISLSDFKF
jgi:hypothetical protein